jgi:PAS domain S-box-containing protein
MVATVTFGASLVTGVLALLLAGGLTAGSVIAITMAAFGFAAIAGATGYLLTRRLSLPLLQLSEAAKRLATGDLTTAIPVSGSEELISLGRSMENARHELEGITRWLTHEKAWAEYLVDSISEGIVTLDAQNRVTFASRAAMTLIGGKRSEALGKSLNDLLVPAENDGHFTDLMPSEGSERTVSVVRADGRTITLTVAGATLKPPVESSARTALVFRDVTSETAMQRLQSYFLGNLSHELQTPLASLRTSAELLVTEHDDLSEQDHHKLHTGIYRGILRLEALIDNLLASASVQAGRFKVKPISMDLGEPIEDAMLFMGPLMEAANISLEIDLPAVVPLVCADSRRITQVLVNLLSNTVKYTPPGSTVQLSALSQDKQFLRVNVADDGPGIPADSRDLIFSRFGRLDSPGARKDHGAGLGLYIAKTIIESHGGAIGVEPRPGKGTIFWFTLPLVVEETI